MSLEADYKAFIKLYEQQAGTRYMHHPGLRRLSWWAWNAALDSVGASNYLGLMSDAIKKSGGRVYSSDEYQRFEQWFCTEYKQPDKPERAKNGQYKQKLHRMLFSAFCARVETC